MSTSAPSPKLDALPSEFIPHLVTLRDHYQGLLTEQEQSILHLQQTVTHLNGLLESPLFPYPGENLETLNPLGIASPPATPSTRKATKKTSRKASTKTKGKGPKPQRTGPDTLSPCRPSLAY
ncbi:MAG: hypothetical protein HC851_16770 [Acaryochloris sp. RU_4_1]|nr:hypothetical protein [Acaryochloris sp. RU_4_1]